MLCEVDGPVSLPFGREKIAASAAGCTSEGSYERAPRQARRLYRSELAKFLLTKGCHWRTEPSGWGAVHTHVYVYDEGCSRVLRISDLENHDDIPIYRPFNAAAFAPEIDRLIEAGEEYERAMGETFFLGMRESARA